jgi:hypothetical protein
VLRLDEGTAKRTGLALASAVPAVDGTAVTSAGWQWGAQLEVAIGRLLKGPTVREVAALARAGTAPGAENFFRVDGGRVEAGAGSPILDASGTVVAVALDVPIRDTVAALAMPAAALKSALLAAQPQLKPLAELPKPLWPARPLRLAGSPVTPAEFAAAVAKLKTAMTCPDCHGTGKMGNADGGGMWGRFLDSIPCRTCHGETIAVNDAMLKLLMALCEQGTRTVWAPPGDERARAAVRAAAADVIRVIGSAQYHFRDRLGDAAGAGLDSASFAVPFGLVVHAQVGKGLDGPDGRYLLLKPSHGSTSVAVRADDLTNLGTKGSMSIHKEPAEGSWILLVGTALARFKAEDARAVFVLPMEWLPATAPPSPPAPRRFDRGPGSGPGSGPGPGPGPGPGGRRFW